MSGRRVVVTGLGAITSLGHDPETIWANLLDGVSGVHTIQGFDPGNIPVRIAAEVRDFDPEVYMDRRTYRSLDRFTQMFWGIAANTLADAGLDYTDASDEEKFRAGVVVGTGIGGIISIEAGIGTYRERGPGRINPYVVTQIIANAGSGQASIALGLQGPNTTVVTACAASANAIGDAAEIIRRDDADVMLAGGAEAAITEFTVAAFANARALSRRNDEPERACRPFDSDRDGFVMAEGGAALVLEELEHARARGAKIYAEIIGYGMSADAFHITLPKPGGMGAARAMQRGLATAGLEPGDIDYINAHGTSTDANDITETLAIKHTFGDAARDLAISSTKSMTGHLLGGAGAMESMVSVLAIRDGVVPPTINLDNPDPECDLDYVPHKARQMDVRTVMTNSFGFGGHNVALVYAKL
jgi:3-oxoacyl-[acyl-carrier-protein] synthase II